MKKKSYRIPFSILLIILILLVLLLAAVETVRIVVAKLAVERIAFTTLRYTVTNSYFYSLCGEEAILSQTAQTLNNDDGLISIPSDKPDSKPIEITSQELGSLDQADGNVDCVFDQEDLDRDTRLIVVQTMQDTARYYSILKVAHQNTPDVLDIHRIKITLCSNRPGFTYDAKTDSCSPHDDVGRFNSGDQVSIQVSYRYGVGSSIGIVVGYISINAFRIGTLEVFR